MGLNQSMLVIENAKFIETKQLFFFGFYMI